MLEARLKHRKDGKWNVDIYEDNIWSITVEGLDSEAEAFAAAAKRGLPVTEIMPDDDNYEHKHDGSMNFPPNQAP